MTPTLPAALDPLPLVAILRGLTPAEAPAIGAALYQAGFKTAVGGDGIGRECERAALDEARVVIAER